MRESRSFPTPVNNAKTLWITTNSRPANGFRRQHLVAPSLAPHLSTVFVPTLCTVWISRLHQNPPATRPPPRFCLLIRGNAQTQEGRGQADRLGKYRRSCGQRVRGVRNKSFRGSNIRGNKQFPNHHPDFAAFNAFTRGAAKLRPRVRRSGVARGSAGEWGCANRPNESSARASPADWSYGATGTPTCCRPTAA